MTLFLLALTLFLQTGCNREEDNKGKLLTTLIVQNTVPKVDSIEFDELQLPTKYEDFFPFVYRLELEYVTTMGLIQSISISNIKRSIEPAIQMHFKIQLEPSKTKMEKIF